MPRIEASLGGALYDVCGVENSPTIRYGREDVRLWLGVSVAGLYRKVIRQRGLPSIDRLAAEIPWWDGQIAG